MKCAFFFFWILSVSCTVQAGPDTTYKILFVGNSLTYTNDLPKLVVKVCKAHDVTVKTTMLAYPGYALEDHWNDGEMQKLLLTGHFDFVLVQQGPSSQAEGRQMLLEYGKKIKTICDSSNTELVFLMVWPAIANFNTVHGVIKSYNEAGEKTGSKVCPVGEAWLNHIQATADFSYYGPDGFHPSLKGSEKAAEIIYQCLFMKL